MCMGDQLFLCLYFYYKPLKALILVLMLLLYLVFSFYLVLKNSTFKLSIPQAAHRKPTLLIEAESVDIATIAAQVAAPSVIGTAL